MTTEGEIVMSEIAAIDRQIAFVFDNMTLNKALDATRRLRRLRKGLVQAWLLTVPVY